MKSFSIVAFALCVFITGCSSFQPAGYRLSDRVSLYSVQPRGDGSSTSTSHKVSLSKPSSLIVVASTLVSVFGMPVFSIPDGDGIQRLPLSTVVVPDASADFRAAQKRTYFRYIPRFSEGMIFFYRLVCLRFDC